MALSSLKVYPATPRRWRDLEQLFGPRGACAGCWCMWWRVKRAQFAKQKGAGNRRALKRIVQKGPPPGLLAYAGREPVGWCAIAPRARYPVLENSRVLARVDEQPVWSVTCFFIARPWRKKGVSVVLLRASSRATLSSRAMEKFSPRWRGHGPAWRAHSSTPDSSKLRAARLHALS